MKRIVGGILLLSLSAVAESKKSPTVGEVLQKAALGPKGESLQQMQKKQTVLAPQDKTQFERKKSNVNLDQVKPPKSSTFVDDKGTDHAKLEKITDQQVQEMYKLTQKYKDSTQRGEMWLRLAELYVEKSKLVDYRKQLEYDKMLELYDNKKLKHAPKLDVSEARDFNKKAIQLYEWFVRDFPKDEKIDQALFFLGYNYYELGNVKKGTEYYDELIRRFPKSPYVVESHFALGEYYFENEKWQSAYDHYVEVTKFKRHQFYSFSLYKLAWCLYRSGQSQKALKAMELLIRTGRQDSADKASGKKSAGGAQKLESEGIRDLIVIYAEAGDPQKAFEYFREIVGPDFKNYVEKLAYYYGDRGNRDASRNLFRLLIQSQPTHPKNVEYQYQIVMLYSYANQPEEFKRELFTWISTYGLNSNWAQANQGNKELMDSTTKLREKTLQTFVMQRHQTAQNSRGEESRKLAYDGYKLFLNEFPQSAAIGDMHFYFGELLYDMGRFNEAGVQYRWVVDHAPQSKFYQTAMLNSVLSLVRDLPSDAEIATRVGKSLTVVAMDPKSEFFVSSAKIFMSKAVENEKTAEITFRVARLYYQHNQFDEALPLFRQIIKKYPTTKFAEYSANLSLDIYNIRKDYAGLEKISQEILSIPAFANSKLGAEIRTLGEKASFKKAQDLEGENKFGESAEQFERFAKMNPQSDLAGIAYFNAAIDYEKAGLVAASILAHQSLLGRKDKSVDKYKGQSRRILAKLLHDSGRIEEAARAYWTAGFESEKDLASNLFFNAALLFQALGKNTESIKNYEEYYRRTEKSDKAEALFEMATLYASSGNSSAAIQKYKEYIEQASATPSRSMDAYSAIYELLQKGNDQDLAKQWKSKLVMAQKNLSKRQKGVGLDKVAKFKFQDAEDAYVQFQKVSIPSDPSKQASALKYKINLLSQLDAQLSEVIKMDVAEEIVNSLNLLGLANEKMFDALAKAPEPKGLTEDELKQYREGVLNIARPFQKKSLEATKAAVEKAQTLGAYPAGYRAAYQRLATQDSNYYEGSEIHYSTPLMSAVGAQ